MKRKETIEKILDTVDDYDLDTLIDIVKDFMKNDLDKLSDDDVIEYANGLCVSVEE